MYRALRRKPLKSCALRWNKQDLWGRLAAVVKKKSLKWDNIRIIKAQLKRGWGIKADCVLEIVIN